MLARNWYAKNTYKVLEILLLPLEGGVWKKSKIWPCEDWKRRCSRQRDCRNNGIAGLCSLCIFIPDNANCFSWYTWSLSILVVLHPSQYFSWIFNFCQSSEYGFYCGFNFNFPDFLWVWAPFRMFISHSCFSWEASIQMWFFWRRVVFFILIYRNFKYILDTHLCQLCV